MSPPLSKILYTDDEPLIVAVARLALEKVGGYQVCLCSSGQQALDQVGAFAPDLILLDVVMPGLDGPQTLAQLRAQPASAAIPVFFVTGNATSTDVAHYRALGAQGVIAKPFNPMTLAAQVQAAWDALANGPLP